MEAFFGHRGNGPAGSQNLVMKCFEPLINDAGFWARDVGEIIYMYRTSI